MSEALLGKEGQIWASDAWRLFISGEKAPNDVSFWIGTSHLLHYSGTAEGLLKMKYKTAQGW